jgi:hypothetical protein
VGGEEDPLARYEDIPLRFLPYVLRHYRDEA